MFIGSGVPCSSRVTPNSLVFAGSGPQRLDVQDTTLSCELPALGGMNDGSLRKAPAYP
jgi:hypothetical protein